LMCSMRNIFDGMMSFDDMLLTPSAPGSYWTDPWNQSAFKVPLNYRDLPFEQRMECLAFGYGTWCIDYFVSWKRLESQLDQKLLWIDYSRDISRTAGDKGALAKTISEYLNLDELQTSSLQKTISKEKVSDNHARINRAVDGRGKEIPKPLYVQLRNIAARFREEFSEYEFETYFT
jgi:hypothetical protein